jgi:hypothetical protein
MRHHHGPQPLHWRLPVRAHLEAGGGGASVCEPIPSYQGSIGTDPAVEVREAEESAAGEAVSPSRPLPDDPVESWQRKKGVKTPLTALESVRPAERSAQTGRRSPP